MSESTRTPGVLEFSNLLSLELADSMGRDFASKGMKETQYYFPSALGTADVRPRMVQSTRTRV